MTRKPILEQDTLSDHTVSYCAFPHGTNMTFHFRIQVLYMLQGLWFFPQYGKGEMKGRALQVALQVLCYLMLGTAVNNLREQICILIYIWFRINLECVVFHQHTPTSEKGKSLLILKPKSRCSTRDQPHNTDS